MNRIDHEIRAKGFGCLGILIAAFVLAVAVWVVINTPAPFNQCPCH